MKVTSDVNNTQTVQQLRQDAAASLIATVARTGSALGNILADAWEKLRPEPTATDPTQDPAALLVPPGNGVDVSAESQELLNKVHNPDPLGAAVLKYVFGQSPEKIRDDLKNELVAEFGITAEEAERLISAMDNKSMIAQSVAKGIVYARHGGGEGWNKHEYVERLLKNVEAVEPYQCFRTLYPRVEDGNFGLGQLRASEEPNMESCGQGVSTLKYTQNIEQLNIDLSNTLELGLRHRES